ncbi:MAG: c-type cytochrome [Aquificota bacterium]|nr:c-type cytochrome [Aquificota bacterium]
MKKLMVALALLGGSTFATDGASIFKAKGCASCHQPTADTVGPSLKKIAQAYVGKEAELVKFLKGQADPIVDPPKFAIMKPQLTLIKNLSDEEFQALADYIMSFK